MDETVFYFYEEPEPEPAGVTVAYLYEWSGEPGPARYMPVVAAVDGEGHGFIEPTGEWNDCIVTAD